MTSPICKSIYPKGHQGFHPATRDELHNMKTHPFIKDITRDAPGDYLHYEVKTNKLK